jgi:tyrosinase
MARRSILTYKTDELTRYYRVMWALKTNGVLDQFTQQHMRAMQHLTLYPGETGTNRNAGHRGPLFFVWHTWLLKQLELAGKQVDPLFELPYFDTMGMSAGGVDWRKSPIWSILGGNGDPNNSYFVRTGPFASGQPWANWWVYIYSNGSFVKRAPAGLKRQFATTGNMPGPPDLNLTPYDVYPYNENVSISACFRRATEMRHDTIHINVGGDIRPGTSPNDPLFYLHHANVDRLWRLWQARHGKGADQYRPQTGAPPENSLTSYLFFAGQDKLTVPIVWPVPPVRVQGVVNPDADIMRVSYA